MQSRYTVKGLEPRTYLISDRRDAKLYVLYVVDVVSPISNVALIIVEASYDHPKYGTFYREVMNFNLWAKDWPQVVATVEGIFDQLYDGLDIGNPVAMTLAVGHQMYDGRKVNYKLNKKVLH